MHVAIADDDGIVLNELSLQFKSLRYVKAVSKFENLKDLMHFLEERPKAIDFLFLDLHFGTSQSHEVIPRIKQLNKLMEIIMYTSDDSSPSLMRCFFAGATGYLPKSTSFSELEQYIKIVLNGGAAITPKIAREMLTFFQPKTSVSMNSGQVLGELETSILKLLANGYSYKEIGGTLQLNINSVKYYLKKMYKKTNVSNRSELVKLYWQQRKE